MPKEAEVTEAVEEIVLPNLEVEEVVEEVVEAAPEYTEAELKAIDMGWNPEGVEGKRNLSAEEFVDRKELYDSIHSLKKTNKRLEESFEALQKHQKHIATKEREKVIKELKAAKKLALEEDNYDAVIDIDDQLAAARKEEESQVIENVNPAFNSWVDENEWYNTDPEMRAYADRIGIGYAAQNKGAAPQDVFDHVEKEVKLRYKEKFASKRTAPSPVEGGGRRTGTNKASKYSESDLPEEARQIMKTLVRSGATTKEDYLKEYFA